jgi:hypothetical protein
LLILAELIAKGNEKLLECLTALVEISLGRLLGFSHASVGQIEELRAVLSERSARQLGELAHQLVPNLFKRALALFGPDALTFESGP